MDPFPPPPSSSSSVTSFPVLAISILGILTTVILLLSYYIFVIKCCLNWRRRPGRLIRTLSTTPSRPQHYTEPPNELRGLEPSAIRSIPIVRFTKETKTNITSNECAVCLNEFHDEESLRLLPNCSHVFHIDCIDIWLQSNANCPLCRSDITRPTLFPFPSQTSTHQEPSVVIDVRNDEATSSRPSNNKERKRHHVSSMGDECIDSRFLVVQPMRRSFSMDSCSDRQLYVAVQEILQQKPELLRGVETGEGSARVRRSFFSFGHGRSSRNAVLPLKELGSVER